MRFQILLLLSGSHSRKTLPKMLACLIHFWIHFWSPKIVPCQQWPVNATNSGIPAPRRPWKTYVLISKNMFAIGVQTWVTWQNGVKTWHLWGSDLTWTYTEDFPIEKEVIVFPALLSWNKSVSLFSTKIFFFIFFFIKVHVTWASRRYHK